MMELILIMLLNNFFI